MADNHVGNSTKQVTRLKTKVLTHRFWRSGHNYNMYMWQLHISRTNTKIACKGKKHTTQLNKFKWVPTKLASFSVKSSDITYHFPKYHPSTLLIKFYFLCLAGTVRGKQFSLYGLTLNALIWKNNIEEYNTPRMWCIYTIWEEKKLRNVSKVWRMYQLQRRRQKEPKDWPG